MTSRYVDAGRLPFRRTLIWRRGALVAGPGLAGDHMDVERGQTMREDASSASIP